MLIFLFYFGRIKLKLNIVTTAIVNWHYSYLKKIYKVRYGNLYDFHEFLLSKGG